ncbi:MAG: ChuX/HutX family heme-like substrate-binding protein [Balneolaceae bacterium]
MSFKSSLKQQWQKLKEESPKLRIKDAAQRLGVSEVELLSTQENVTKLKEDWSGLFKAVESLGYVMALTRNESVVHERKGEYHNISFEGHVGLVLDPNIDLRIFQNRFGFAYAIPVENPRGKLLSIQFFDKHGTAAHKIYLMNEDHIDDYYALVETFKHEDQTSELEVAPKKESSPQPSVEPIDKDALLSDWAELKDTHDFYPLLMKHKVERTQALKLAEGTFTQKVANASTETMLLKAAKQNVSIMVFVSSGPVIQIHTGEIEHVKKMDAWLNVLDPEFNLHLREDHIAHSWIVEKPTDDGIVTSLEIFDSNLNNIATFFGARKPGIPELESWRNLVSELKAESVLS